MYVDRNHLFDRPYQDPLELKVQISINAWLLMKMKFAAIW